MKPLIIPFFLRNRGCTHRCVFCNERIISGNAEAITEAGVRETVRSTIAGRRKSGPVEIAFYGGSFTGMAREEQMELLRMAGALIGEGAVHSIRISTRPDDIEGAWLDTLKKYGGAGPSRSAPSPWTTGSSGSRRAGTPRRMSEGPSGS